MNVIVCGGRNVSGDAFRKIVTKSLYAIHSGTPIANLIDSGASHDVANLAREWARVHDIQTKSFKADFKRYKGNCGNKRNTRMIDYALNHDVPNGQQNSVMLIVFKDKHNRGTKDIIRQATAANIYIWTVEI